MPIDTVVDKNLEQLALRTICTNTKTGNLLLSKLNKDHWAWEPTQEAYECLSNFFQDHARPLTWGEILHIPIISKESRTILAGFRGRPINDSQVVALVNALDYWRRLRKFWQINKSVNTAFTQNDKIDLDRLGNHIAELISEARTSGIKKHLFTHMGTGSNIKPVIEEILKGDNTTYIPTGFRAFDSVNEGLPRGELFYASAPSGQLKTALLTQMGLNMAMAGATVAYVPLEMNEVQLTRRNLSNFSHIPLGYFLTAKRLNTKQKEFIWQKVKEYEDRLKTLGSRFTIVTPDGGISLDECLAILTPHHYDVVILDYISLFEDANNEKEMWRQLSRMAWKVKIWAQNNNAVGAIGAQLNETDLTVRYARAINEHSAISFRWLVDKTTRETGILTVELPKSRMQNPQPFELKVEPQFMIVRDLTPEEQSQSNLNKNTNNTQKERPKTKAADLEDDYYKST